MMASILECVLAISSARHSHSFYNNSFNLPYKWSFDIRFSSVGEQRNVAAIGMFNVTDVFIETDQSAMIFFLNTKIVLSQLQLMLSLIAL